VSTWRQRWLARRPAQGLAETLSGVASKKWRAL
jgi:hypothetical protein